MIKHIFLGLFLCLFATKSYAVDVHKIDLFITSSMKVQHEQFARDINFRIHVVDAPKQLERQVSKSLPANESEAREQLKKMIASPGFSNNFAKAYKAPLLAMKLGIRKLPAAVINDKAVIYGSTDLADILNHAESQ